MRWMDLMDDTLNHRPQVRILNITLVIHRLYAFIYSLSILSQLYHLFPTCAGLDW